MFDYNIFKSITIGSVIPFSIYGLLVLSVIARLSVVSTFFLYEGLSRKLDEVVTLQAPRASGSAWLFAFLSSSTLTINFCKLRAILFWVVVRAIIYDRGLVLRGPSTVFLGIVIVFF